MSNPLPDMNRKRPRLPETDARRLVGLIDYLIQMHLFRAERWDDIPARRNVESARRELEDWLYGVRD